MMFSSLLQLLLFVCAVISTANDDDVPDVQNVYYGNFSVFHIIIGHDFLYQRDWSDRVLRPKLDPGFNTNPHLPVLGNMTVKRSVPWILNKQRVEMEKLVGMFEGGEYGRLKMKIRDILTGSIGYYPQERAGFIKFLESSMENQDYDELYKLLMRKLDNIAMEAEFISESDHLSPRELVEVITTATQLQQLAVVQQQIEKIERLQQVMEEEGAPILRRTKREAKDEKQEEIHLLLVLLVLWFLLCYCSEGTLWCVDVELIFGLSLALSEIVLLLGGDIEENPGPLTDQELAKVDPTHLSEDDLGIVCQAVFSLAGHWHILCLFLGLPKSKLDAIKRNHAYVEDCLSEGLSEWLQRNYDDKKCGLPSWRALITCVDSINCALARSLAEKHNIGHKKLLREVSVEEQSIKDSQPTHHDGFDCSSNFSFVFREISRCLKKDLPKVKRLRRYLDFFSHPKHKHRRYIKRKVYKGARSTRGILYALFPKYISATDIKLLRCIV